MKKNSDSYSPLRRRMAFAMIGTSLACAATSQAQLVSFSSAALGAGNTGTGLVNATTLPATMSFGQVSRGPGVGIGAGTSRYNSTAFTGADQNAAISGNDYIRFTIAPAANTVYNITTVGMNLGRSSTGPTNWGIFAGNIGFTASGAALATGTPSGNVTPALNRNNLTSALEIRLYAWGGQAAGTFGPGNGSALNINGSAASRTAGTLVWDGGQGNGNWNSYSGTAANQSNWNLNNLPTASLVDALQFAGSTQLNTSNNVAGLTAGSITFNSGAGAFTNGGNSLTLNGGVTNNSTNNQTIAHALALSNASHAFATASGNVTVSGAISGLGSLVKTGANQLTLSGGNDYTGGTSLQDGTILASNAKALGTGNVAISGDGQLVVGNGIVLDIGAGNSITLGSDTAGYLKNFSSGESFANASAIESNLAGGIDTTAAIRGGASSGASSLTMSFSTGDLETSSDVLSLSGIDGQAFVLSLSVGAGVLDTDNALGWFDSVDGWELAVAGNSGAGVQVLPTYLGYQGSFAQFQSLVVIPGTGVLSDYLGAYGVDTATGEAWAIVNHNSDFAIITVVPEPGTAALLATAGVVLMVFRRRRQA